MTAGDDTAPPVYQCPTPCDDACDALCHEGHDVIERWAHDVTDCEQKVLDARAAVGPRAGDTAPDDDAAYDAEMVRRCLETMDLVHINNTLRNQVAELNRLRSGAAALRDAGEALAAKAVDVSQAICGTEEMAAEILDDAVFAWRSAAGPSTTDGGDC